MKFTRVADFIYTLRIISILTTPWEKQEAYKYGIIDKEGKQLRKYKDLKTPEEKNSYTYLHRLIFNLKRLLEKIPGGDSWIAAATASLMLLKENLEELNLSDESWKKIEEAIFDLQEETPVNVSGTAVSTDVPKPLSLVRRKEKTNLDTDDDFKNKKDDL